MSQRELWVFVDEFFDEAVSYHWTLFYINEFFGSWASVFPNYGDNCTVPGIIICSAILFGNALAFGFGTLATLISFIFIRAHIGQTDLYNEYAYNNVLVGLAISAFMSGKVHTGHLLIATVVFSGFSQLLQFTLDTSRFPVATYPFNMTMIVCLMSIYEMPIIHLNPIIGGTLSPSNVVFEDYIQDLELDEFFKGVCSGFSQIFLVDDWISGLIIFLGLSIYNLGIGLLGFTGSLFSAGTAVLLGIEMQKVYAGLLSFNGCLLAIRLGVLFNNEVHSTFYVAFLFFCNMILIVPVQLFTERFLAVYGVPSMTLPFCFMFTITNSLQSFINTNNEVDPSIEEQQIEIIENQEATSDGIEVQTRVESEEFSKDPPALTDPLL